MTCSRRPVWVVKMPPAWLSVVFQRGGRVSIPKGPTSIDSIGIGADGVEVFLSCLQGSPKARPSVFTAVFVLA
jgi:hypothetical protein